jgi:hypothetical protein
VWRPNFDVQSAATATTTFSNNTANMSRPTVTIHGADGSPSNDSHPLPNVFKAPIRPDIVQYDIRDEDMAMAIGD